jgi:hypothetical protein
MLYVLNRCNDSVPDTFMIYYRIKHSFSEACECPIVHWIVAAGRLPFDIQDTVTGTVSSVLTVLEMNDVVFGFTELI